MDFASLLRDYWEVFLAFIALVTLIVRIELKVNTLEKAHEDQTRNFEKHHESQSRSIEKHNDAVWDKLNGMQLMLTTALQTVARLEGKLDARRDANMQSDL